MEPHTEAIFSGDCESNDQMVNYMLNNSPDSDDELINLRDVLQFSNFDPNAALNQPNYFDGHDYDPFNEHGENLEKSPVLADERNRRKRKRPRSTKTSEQVQNQRMTHIAIERNRRKQMNEHLRIIKTLMPSSYVQRGDQASIIGGAIEFVRELQQLLQCLESQKRRRLYVDSPIGDNQMMEQSSIRKDQIKVVEYDQNGLLEEKAEIKSCLADVEVKVLGVDGLIKILSRRQPGQLIKTIAGLEDLQLNIIYTNVTTIEQNVLYSFKIKMDRAAVRLTAQDIANSTQQILTNFINGSSCIPFNNVLEY